MKREPFSKKVFKYCCLISFTILLLTPCMAIAEEKLNGEYTIIDEGNGWYTATYPDFSITLQAPEGMMVFHKDSDPDSAEAKKIFSNRKNFISWQQETFGPDKGFCLFFISLEGGTTHNFGVYGSSGYPRNNYYIGSLLENPAADLLLNHTCNVRTKDKSNLLFQEVYHHPQTLFLYSEFYSISGKERWESILIRTVYNNREVDFEFAKLNETITDEERAMVQQVIDSARFTVPETNRFEYPKEGFAFEVPWQVNSYGLEGAGSENQAREMQDGNIVCGGSIRGNAFVGGADLQVMVEDESAARFKGLEVFIGEHSIPIWTRSYAHPQGDFTERLYCENGISLLVREKVANGKRYGFSVLKVGDTIGEMDDYTVEMLNRIIDSVEFYEPVDAMAAVGTATMPPAGWAVCGVAMAALMVWIVWLRKHSRMAEAVPEGEQPGVEKAEEMGVSKEAPSPEEPEEPTRGT